MANPAIPVLERQVGTKPLSGTPDFQTSVNAFAASNNNLSAIGAQVAQSANNQMAADLGFEEGKKPHGNLMPAITDFDKNFAESYKTQANATLSIQGHKLLTDSQIELSKANRLTPGLIAKTNEQLQKGLMNISENAPTEIRGQLEASFASQLINQDAQFKQKMIGQQREDQKNTIINGVDLNTRNASELAINGDFKGSLLQVQMAKNAAESARASGFFTPEQARVAHEAAEQASINGRYIHLAQQAYNAGRLPQFEKEFASSNHGLTNEQYIAAGQAFQQQMNFLQTLRSQDDTLKSQQMLNQIALNPGAITASQWTDFTNSVSDIKAEQVKFHYIQALNKHKTEGTSTDELIKNYSNPIAHANADKKIKDAAFNKSVGYMVENTKDSANPLTLDDAEVQVAASAGAQVPVFTQSLKNKLSSANPVFIESASQQIHALRAMGAGRALSGLDDKDKAAYTKYESLRDSTDPVTAAREATNIVYNQDDDVEKMNKQKWANFMRKQTQGGISEDVVALHAVDLKPSDFITPSMAEVYGTNILAKYKSFYTILNGDQNSALKLTKQYVDENYGDTEINGGSFKTLHPIEKVLGFSSSDAVPYIQHDMINQFNEKLIPTKVAFDNKTSNEYWEAIPVTIKEFKPSSNIFARESKEGNLASMISANTSQDIPNEVDVFGRKSKGKNVAEAIGNTQLAEGYTPPSSNPSQERGVIFKSHDPVKIKRHIRTPKGETTDTFNVILQGNSFDTWDVAIQTNVGMRNLFQFAPFLHIINYKPNDEAIHAHYNKDHTLK